MLVLASASPRRKELLVQAGYDFKVVPANIPEERQPHEEPTAFVTRLAQEKARAVLDQLAHNATYGPLIVLGADTIVVVGEEILGKPRDAEDAARMLRLLSGRIHQVMTGVCVISMQHVEVCVETTSCHDAGDSGEGNRRLHRNRRANGQGWCLRDPGLRRTLDPSH